MEVDPQRPIPKPRRTILESNKLKYENVTIDVNKRELRIGEHDEEKPTQIVQKLSTKELEKSTFSGVDENDFRRIVDLNENSDGEDERPTPAPRRPAIKKSPSSEVCEDVVNQNVIGTRNKESRLSCKSLDIPKRSKNEYDVQRSATPNASSFENWGEYNLEKSMSNSTIDSSTSSVSSTDNQKYRSLPPSQLLKNLGTTSKLLTEAITERVSLKAKNAKQKLNDNIKMSQDFLTTLGTDTATRIKSVRKKLHSPIKGNASSHAYEMPTNENASKSQVLNDQVFKSISFNSPINGKENPNSSASPETYEIPKSSYRKTDDDCPTFEEAMRNQPLSLKKFGNVHKSESSEYGKSPPMPNYPAPILQEEAIYGRVREIQPPARLKRNRKSEKFTSATGASPVSPPTASTSSSPSARESSLSCASNRATVDSLEISSMMADSSPEKNKEINEEIKIRETSSSNPMKSESWIYYDNEDEGSSPEPIYANQEATYDKLSEMGTNDSRLILSPKPDTPKSASRSSRKFFDEKDLLYEFDPLMKKNVGDFFVNKSNQLLLLEHLLEDETYGTVETDPTVMEESQSMASSEEDNGNAACAMSPPTPVRVDSLQKTFIFDEENNASDNSKLDNIEEMEATIQSFLAKTDETENIPDPQSQTNWFVNCGNIHKPENFNPFNKNSQDVQKKVSKTISLPKLKNSEDLPPPTYAEAIATTPTVTPTNEKFTAEPQKIKSKSVFSNVMNKMDVLKRKTSFRTNRSKDVKVVLEMVPKPTISNIMVRHEGPLIRFPSGVVEDILNDMQNRKAILRDKKFQTYHDQAMKNLKESFLLENITTIQCVSNNKITDSFTHLYCFEITIAIQKNQSSQQVLSNPNMIVTSKDSGNCKLQRINHLYGVGKESERDIWMQKLVESLTTVFPSNYTCQYYRAGWCYLKRSITSPWSGTWILLKKRKRKLLFYSDHEMNLEKVDLRKARCIVLKENDGTIKNLHVESGPILMLDCPPFTLYLVMNFSRETKIWRHIIREVAHNNGPSLNDQQITKFNVPVIVDKCINFIYIYGSMSEGIYRKSGSEASIQKLISLFRVNAFSVEITKPEYSEHDVANVLKRFMRDLPQKLLSRYSTSFCSITHIKSKSDKIASYKELLGRLSVIEYQTLKKLIGHLSFISSLNSKNKMGIDNLAMIWGPTILQNKQDEQVYSQKEADVISELILLYKDLFLLSADEMKKEKDMLECLQKYYASGESLSSSMKKSGDLKVWVTLNVNSGGSKEDKTQINVTLTPTKTAYEVCKELSAKTKLPPYQLTLFEVVMNENLERPLHHDEKVFDVVLQWSYWSDVDRKNNFLIVKKNDLLKEVERALRNLPTVSPGKELKFADNKTKSLKLLNVELRDSVILIQKKEKNVVTIVKEIMLPRTTVYLGCEKKREISNGWAITFIQTDNNTVVRSKETPFIGHVIAGTEWKDRVIWFSSIWHSLYGGDNILPQAEIVF